MERVEVERTTGSLGLALPLETRIRTEPEIRTDVVTKIPINCLDVVNDAALDGTAM